MAKSKYLVINLKNKLLYIDALKYAKELKKQDLDDLKIIMAPGNIYLTLFKNPLLELCAQNVSNNDFICTGEENAYVLKSLGCNYALVGHSERRKFYDDEYSIEKKIKNCLKNDIKVMYCIGETQKTHELILKENLKIQIKNVFDFVDNKENIIIAYEPTWAIGNEEKINISEIENVIKFIKDYILKKYKLYCKVLYGGSVNQDNIKKFYKSKYIDGVLISSSANDFNSLNELLKKIR